jgi:N-methylhydantoinase A
VPPNPGNVSAFGLLTVDVKNDYVQTHVSLASALEPATVASAYDELTERAAAALAKEGFAAEQHQFARTADLRYFGQAFEVRVPVPDGPVAAGVLDEVADRFHAEHRALYGYDFAGDPTQQVEWVNLRVSGIGPIRRPEIRSNESVGWFAYEAAEQPQRDVCFDPDAGYVSTPLFDRSELPAGATVSGPAIVEEFGSTTVVFPGWLASVDAYRNLVMKRED